jgi:hypothetical protein
MVVTLMNILEENLTYLLHTFDCQFCASFPSVHTLCSFSRKEL